MKLIIAMTLLITAISSMAYTSDQKDFSDFYKETYPNSSRITNCNLCHTGSLDLNPYGQAYVDSDYDFEAIEQLDSDNDGIINIDEIAAGTNPGK